VEESSIVDRAIVGGGACKTVHDGAIYEHVNDFIHDYTFGLIQLAAAG